MDELVAKAKNGDKEAFSKLVVFVKSDLYKMAKTNDIIQNTLFIAYQNINKLHYDKYFKTWIIRILINECNKFYKEQKRSQNIIDRYTNNHDFEEYDFDESDINIDDIKKLLTDKEKEMFNLYYVEHLTTKQIAKIMNINENTVKSRLKTGRDRIKSKYSRIALMILVVFVVATSAVFGKDIINYIKNLFNLHSVGYNNDSILDAIEDKEWVQNVDMDYIELNDEYSIKVDYLLFDDINLYMIFDLKSKSGFGENNRFSIITENLDKCFICGAKKEELHEVFEGKNRQMSMKYGLVIPICRKCHKSIPNNKTLREKIHKVGQKAFKNRYKNENFIKIFGKNYL